MKVFVFDLLAYGEQLDHLKVGSELPYPLSSRYFKADVAVRTYAEHLEAWEEMDRLGYDGVGFNEHHCSPYGLMNSPNLMAAAAAQRTKKLKLLIYGNLLPLHEPLRLAEELAMLDCLSNGRLISGFARGIPREYQVHNVPLKDSRARFEEAYEIVTRAWTEDIFSYRRKILVLQGRGDLAAAGAEGRARKSGFRSSAARNRSSSPAKKNAVITPGLARGGLQEDIIRYFAKCLAKQRPQDHAASSLDRAAGLCRRQQGGGGAASSRPITSISTARCSATATSPRPPSSATPATSRNPPTTMCGRRTCSAAQGLREDYRNMTMADFERQAEHMPFGTAKEVTERIIARRKPPAPTRCRSASIAARCRMRCSWSRSGASRARCCRRCRRMRCAACRSARTFAA